MPPNGLSRSSKEVVVEVEGAKCLLVWVAFMCKDVGEDLAVFPVEDAGVVAWVGVSHGDDEWLDVLCCCCIRCCSIKDNLDMSTGFGVVDNKLAKASLGFWEVGTGCFTVFEDDGADQLRSNKSSIAVWIQTKRNKENMELFIVPLRGR